MCAFLRYVRVQTKTNIQLCERPLIQYKYETTFTQENIWSVQRGVLTRLIAQTKRFSFKRNKVDSRQSKSRLIGLYARAFCMPLLSLSELPPWLVALCNTRGIVIDHMAAFFYIDSLGDIDSLGTFRLNNQFYISWLSKKSITSHAV